jgi:hypothetical protein
VAVFAKQTILPHCGTDWSVFPPFNNLLLQQWIPAMPAVQSKLQRGARVADVGCGRGRALIKLAQAFVIHDAVDPLGFLRALRRALASDGVYVCLDTNCSDKLEENFGPLGSMFYGFSVLYRMTTSLAWGSAGLGTLGFHERKVQEMCSEAGFSQRAEGAA